MKWKKPQCKYCKSENLIMRISENNIIGLYCKDCNGLKEYITPSQMRKLKMKGYELEGYY